MQSDVLPQVVVHTLDPPLSGTQMPPGQLELSAHPLAIMPPPPPAPLEPLAPPREMVTVIGDVEVDVDVGVNVEVDGLPPVPKVPTGPPLFRHALAKTAEARMNLEIHLDSDAGR